MKKRICTFDIDGVIFMGDDGGVYPGKDDIIITGRSFEEEEATNQMLASKGITNFVCFNPIHWKDKTRETSGIHKANTLNDLIDDGHDIFCHYEDDPIQADIIKQICPRVNVVLLVHDLVEKENVWHQVK